MYDVEAGNYTYTVDVKDEKVYVGSVIVSTVNVIEKVAMISTIFLNKEREQIILYPNPTSTLIKIENAKGEGVAIYNSKGIMLKRVSCTQFQEIIDVNELKEGVYIFQIGDQYIKVSVIYEVFCTLFLFVGVLILVLLI